MGNEREVWARRNPPSEEVMGSLVAIIEYLDCDEEEDDYNNQIAAGADVSDHIWHSIVTIKSWFKQP